MRQMTVDDLSAAELRIYDQLMAEGEAHDYALLEAIKIETRHMERVEYQRELDDPFGY